MYAWYAKGRLEAENRPLTLLHAFGVFKRSINPKIQITGLAGAGMVDHRVAADNHEADFIPQAQLREIAEVCRQFDLCHKRVRAVFPRR